MAQLGNAGSWSSLYKNKEVGLAYLKKDTGLDSDSCNMIPRNYNENYNNNKEVFE